jgi:hypothetical protein
MLKYWDGNRFYDAACSITLIVARQLCPAPRELATKGNPNPHCKWALRLRTGAISCSNHSGTMAETHQDKRAGFRPPPVAITVHISDHDASEDFIPWAFLPHPHIRRVLGVHSPCALVA